MNHQMITFQEGALCDRAKQILSVKYKQAVVVLTDDVEQRATHLYMQTLAFTVPLGDEKWTEKAHKAMANLINWLASKELLHQGVLVEPSFFEYQITGREHISHGIMCYVCLYPKVERQELNRQAGIQIACEEGAIPECTTDDVFTLQPNMDNLSVKPNSLAHCQLTDDSSDCCGVFSHINAEGHISCNECHVPLVTAFSDYRKRLIAVLGEKVEQVQNMI